MDLEENKSALELSRTIPLNDLLLQVRSCRICEAHLPFGPRPVVRASTSASVLIIGQAPGTRVHRSGIPWDDPSGDRLRQWMQLGHDNFYDESKIAIVPMGFCYPGKGRSGDLPPRKECAEHWHANLLSSLPNIELTLLIGSYAQHYYLPSSRKMTLTERVRQFEHYGPSYFPLVHPSPRNTHWIQKNTWFEKDVLPTLQKRLKDILQ